MLTLFPETRRRDLLKTQKDELTLLGLCSSLTQRFLSAGETAICFLLSAQHSGSGEGWKHICNRRGQSGPRPSSQSWIMPQAARDYGWASPT